MANTISTRTYRDKYRLNTLDTLLRRSLVAEKVYDVDNTDLKRIQSPYGTQPTATIQALAGTYSIADFTTTDENLDVDNEIIVAEHIKDFEDVMSNFDLFASRTEEQMFAVASKIDEFALNVLAADAGASYSTPAGGFSAANVNQIFADIIGKFAGFSEAYNGQYIIIENTEIPAIAVAKANSGFNTADAMLNNGLLTQHMGVDIYVTRSGLFKSATVGTRTFTNSGKRVAGIYRQATYASPRSIRFSEKEVSGKTGMEVVTYGYIGAKVWTPKANLTCAITITA